MFRLISLAAALLVAVSVHAQPAPKVKDAGQVRTLLYIGNSFFYFNDSMHSIALRLVAPGNSHKGGLDAKTADFLQQVAADTVKEYLGKDL